MRSLVALIASFIAIGCTKSNPEYCEASSDCTADPSRPFCDVDGSFDGTANACIPTPADAPDAAPPPVDAAATDAACTPTTCEAEGKNCGQVDDGCDGTLECGFCVVPLSCGGGAEENVCGGTCVSASWTSELIEAADQTTTTSIAIGPFGGIHVAATVKITGAGRQVTYAHRTIGSWMTESADTAAVGELIGVSLGVDSDDGVHVSYIKCFGYSPQYGYLLSGSTWQLEEIATEFAEQTSIAVDGADGLHVAMDGMYASRASGGAWSGLSDITTPGSFPSISVDLTGKLHVAVYDGPAGKIVYASKAIDAAWVTEIVDDASAAGYVRSLAVDTAGVAHVAYDNSELKYAQRPVGGSWSNEIVDGALGVGGHASIAVQAGFVHIAYVDSVNGDLKYAVGKPGGPWTIQRADTTGDEVAATAIAVDGSGGVHVVYTNNAGGLRYAYRCP